MNDEAAHRRLERMLAEAYSDGVRAERERCAKIAEGYPKSSAIGAGIATLIRKG